MTAESHAKRLVQEMLEEEEESAVFNVKTTDADLMVTITLGSHQFTGTIWGLYKDELVKATLSYDFREQLLRVKSPTLDEETCELLGYEIETDPRVNMVLTP